jgi:hypothetical protein
MSIPQKFIPPDIAREELTPRELELLAVLEQLTDMVNRQARSNLKCNTFLV